MNKLSFNSKIRSLQIAFHVLAVIGLFYLIRQPQLSSVKYLSLSIGMFWVLGTIGINVCLHRYLTHRSFACTKRFKIFSIFLANLCLVGTPLSWPAIHRWHHKHSDTELDPHSPLILGNFRSWVGLWRPVVIPTKITRDLISDREVVFFHRHYFSTILFTHFAVALISPMIWIFALVIPAVLCLHATSVISVLCHRFGYKNHVAEQTTFNNPLAAIITLGEGWHNNHHAFPSRLKQGEKWWELELPYLIISQIRTDKT